MNIKKQDWNEKKNQTGVDDKVKCRKEDTEQMACPCCGKLLAAGSRFCPYCMKKLDGNLLVPETCVLKKMEEVPDRVNEPESAMELRADKREKKRNRKQLLVLCLLILVLGTACVILRTAVKRQAMKQELNVDLEQESRSESRDSAETGTDPEGYRDYIGTWETITENAYLAVKIQSVEGTMVSGWAELESLGSGRLADIDFSGIPDETGTFTCSYEEDGWGAGGTITICLQDHSVRIQVKEETYGEDYTGEWSFGDQDLVLDRKTTK